MANHDTHDHTGIPGVGAPTEITDIPTAETDTDKRLAPDGAGGVEWAAAAGAPTRIEYVLGADVAMATANTFYDGPSGTPAAGTYDVIAFCQLKNGTNATTAFVARLVTGSTVVDERQFCYIGATDNGYPSPIPLTARVVLDGSTILKITATSDKASAVMCRDPFNNSSGVHRASIIVAVRVA